MRRIQYLKIAIWTMIQSVSVSSAFAERKVFTPEWNGVSAQSEFRDRSDQASKLLNNSLSSSVIAKMNQDSEIVYQRGQIERELTLQESRRQARVQNDPEAMNTNRNMQTIVQSTFTRFSRGQLNEQSKETVKDFKDSSLAQPAMVAAAAAGLYSGRNFRFKVADGVKLNTRAAIKDKKASMGIEALGMRSQIEMQTGVGVSAALIAPLTDHVSASVNSVNKGQVSLNYGISF